jgi:hypothetical protein
MPKAGLSGNPSMIARMRTTQVVTFVYVEPSRRNSEDCLGSPTEEDRMITSSIEIDRPQAVVFAYLDELDKHSEWQGDLISSRLETEGPVGVGTRASPADQRRRVAKWR